MGEDILDDIFDIDCGKDEAKSTHVTEKKYVDHGNNIDNIPPINDILNELIEGLKPFITGDTEGLENQKPPTLKECKDEKVLLTDKKVDENQSAKASSGLLSSDDLEQFRKEMFNTNWMNSMNHDEHLNQLNPFNASQELMDEVDSAVPDIPTATLDALKAELIGGLVGLNSESLVDGSNEAGGMVPGFEGLLSMLTASGFGDTNNDDGTNGDFLTSVENTIADKLVELILGPVEAELSKIQAQVGNEEISKAKDQKNEETRLKKEQLIDDILLDN